MFYNGHIALVAMVLLVCPLTRCISDLQVFIKAKSFMFMCANSVPVYFMIVNILLKEYLENLYV